MYITPDIPDANPSHPLDMGVQVSSIVTVRGVGDADVLQ